MVSIGVQRTVTGLGVVTSGAAAALAYHLFTKTPTNTDLKIAAIVLAIFTGCLTILFIWLFSRSSPSQDQSSGKASSLATGIQPPEKGPAPLNEGNPTKPKETVKTFDAISTEASAPSTKASTTSTKSASASNQSPVPASDQNIENTSAQQSTTHTTYPSSSSEERNRNLTPVTLPKVSNSSNIASTKSAKNLAASKHSSLLPTKKSAISNPQSSIHPTSKQKVPLGRNRQPTSPTKPTVECHTSASSRGQNSTTKRGGGVSRPTASSAAKNMKHPNTSQQPKKLNQKENI